MEPSGQSASSPLGEIVDHKGEPDTRHLDQSCLRRARADVQGEPADCLAGSIRPQRSSTLLFAASISQQNEAIMVTPTRDSDVEQPPRLQPAMKSRIGLIVAISMAADLGRSWCDRGG
jgi:hypothetical protein